MERETKYYGMLRMQNLYPPFNVKTDSSKLVSITYYFDYSQSCFHLLNIYFTLHPI